MASEGMTVTAAGEFTTVVIHPRQGVTVTTSRLSDGGGGSYRVAGAPAGSWAPQSAAPTTRRPIPEAHAVIHLSPAR